MIRQLDENLSQDQEDTNNINNREVEIKEAFMEFYKLLDDYDIIDKSSYQNINYWFEEEKENMQENMKN